MKFYDPNLDTKLSRKSGLFRISSGYKNHVYHEQWVRFYKEKTITVDKYELHGNVVYTAQLLERNPLNVTVVSANSIGELFPIMEQLGYSY